MKFTLSWLKDYLDTDASLPVILEKLTDIGLEVEGVDDPAKSFAPFIIGHIKTAEQHPDADRLRLCMVDIGADELVQVVCGAPNAKAGIKVVFAPPGSYIPGLDVTLKIGKIRGVESRGMMVSERELNLSDEHDGIIQLDDDAPVGMAYAQYAGYDDPIIEIGLTPNRADCASIYGIARDLAAAGLGTLKPLTIPQIKTSQNNGDIAISIADDQQDFCPIFIGRKITGVKNGPSPQWLQKRLTAIGLRPISALVDITNYFTIAFNRPLHVYDQAKLSGAIQVRSATQGEELAALDGKTYILQDGMTAICDDSGVIGLGGIIGGEPTGVDENTTDLVLEAAYFDPMRIARTGRDLGIISDARYRFERGIDAEFIFDGAALATQMILDICGGQACDQVQAGACPAPKPAITYAPSKCAKITGVDVDAQTQKDILTRLGFGFNGTDTSGDASQNTTWQVTIPSWRPDISADIDLVEEIIRIVGYDKLDETPITRDPSSIFQGYETRNVTQARLLRALLATRGMNEAITWSFMPTARAELFGANDNQDVAHLRLLNPISSDLDHMRPTILPNLIEAASRNFDKGIGHSQLFEIGPCFKDASPQGQFMSVAGIRSGQFGPKNWSNPSLNRPVDAFDAKADIMAALDVCGFDGSKAPISRDAPSYYHPGQSGCLRLGKNILGYFGMIHPAILQEMGIDFAVTAFELFPENIPAPKQKSAAKGKLSLPDLQPLTRDFAFILAKDVPADNVVRAAMGVDKKLIQDVQIFDVYTGKGIDENEKSLGITITIQPIEKTLTEKDLNDLSQKVIDQITQKMGGRLRG